MIFLVKIYLVIEISKLIIFFSLYTGDLYKVQRNSCNWPVVVDWLGRVALQLRHPKPNRPVRVAPQK